MRKKSSFNLLDSVFHQRQITRKERYAIELYGFFTYILILNLILFVSIAFSGNSSSSVLSTYFLAVFLIIILPNLIVMLTMEVTLKFDFPNVLKYLLRHFDVFVEICSSRQQCKFIVLRGRTLKVYPYLKILTNETEKTIGIIRWGDVALLNFKVSPKESPTDIF